MSKHLQNLERLCKKMQVRFGDGDDVVHQFKQELCALEKKKLSELAAHNHFRQIPGPVAPARAHY